MIARRDLFLLTSLSAAPLKPAPALRPFSGSVSLGEMALYPDPALRTVAQPVTEYGAPAAALGDALVGAMDRLGAVGVGDCEILRDRVWLPGDSGVWVDRDDGGNVPQSATHQQ